MGRRDAPIERKAPVAKANIAVKMIATNTILLVFVVACSPC